MPSKKRLLFVVNPISGGKSKSQVPAYIKKFLDHRLFTYEVYNWDILDELPSVIQDFVKNNGYAVVAIGGDGTINALATELVNTSVRLAIVPQGSGNGFAREFKISRSVPLALRQLNKAKEQCVDVGKMNGKVFVNVAGWGFDAKVSHTFAHITKRGFRSYVKAIYKDFGGSHDLAFIVNSGDASFTEQAFMLSVANGRQWGNHFYMAPKASFSDGILDMVFLRKPKLYQVPYLVCCLYFKLNNPLITRYKIEHATIKLEKSIYTHYDGEPASKEDSVSIELLPKALRILV
jgi:diacylglycerol kinase (ATP)